MSDLYDEPTVHHSHEPSNSKNLNDTRATVLVYNNSDDSHESHPIIVVNSCPAYPQPFFRFLVWRPKEIQGILPWVC